MMIGTEGRMRNAVRDRRIERVVELAAPATLLEELPLGDEREASVVRGREEVREALTSLHTQDGRPLVGRVLRADPSGAPPPLLPDLVVHWTDAFFTTIRNTA